MFRIVILCWTAWGAALVLLTWKILRGGWLDSITRYGKLQSGGSTGLLSTKTVFVCSYIAAWVWNILLVASYQLILQLYSVIPELHCWDRDVETWAPCWSLIRLWDKPSSSDVAPAWPMAYPTFQFSPALLRAVTLEALPYVALMQIQLTRRAYECLVVHRFTHRKVSNVAALLALAFYFFACFAPQMEILSSVPPPPWNASYAAKAANMTWRLPAGVTGVLLFVYASVHQFRCHSLLASLRRNRHSAESAAPQFDVPHGDWFKYVSSPHYFAEILIYLSFVLVTSARLISVWLMLAFVVGNLTYSALLTQRWYRSKFANYPVERKAIIPGVL